MIGDGDCGEIGGMEIGRQVKAKYSEKTCPRVNLSTTNPTLQDPDLNTGRRGGKPGTNRLSYSAATRWYPSSQFNSHPIRKTATEMSILPTNVGVLIKSLTFPICSTNKRIFLARVKEVTTRKS
jgi:hypothetical protein